MATTQGNPGKKATAPAVAKHSKGHRHAPAQYAPKAKAPVAEKVQTDPMGVWHGYLGKHEINGMTFETVKKVDGKGRDFRATFVVEAPEGTALHGMAGSSVYVTTGQIHSREIKPSFPEGHSSRTRQMRLWNFLNQLFLDLGIKKVEAPKPAKETEAAPVDTSVSIAGFAIGTCGKYCFDDQAPRAVFDLDMVPYRKDGQTETVANITLVSVDAGHHLYGKVKIGMKLFHSILSHREPAFKGDDAGGRYLMWEFLTDIVAAHKALCVTYSGKS